MRVIKECAGLYMLECNGKYWSVTDTQNFSDRGAWRWNVSEIGENDCGYNTGTLKEAKQIAAKYSI